MAQVKNPADMLPTCTVRIEGERAGQKVSVGTGFLFDFVPEAAWAGIERGEPPGRVAPALITNNHVVHGCDFASITLTVAPIGSPIDPLGMREGRSHVQARVEIGQHVVRHPDAAVDLCAIPIAHIVQQVQASGLEPLHSRLWHGNLFARESRAELRYIEPIAMVGYPRGLWDSANNAPIVRRGSTATHPFVAYEGRPEFLIDAACFPGSSGSPVFLFQDGMYMQGGQAYTGIRTALLGILYAGPQFSATGELHPVPIPHAVSGVPVTSIPMNLGFVINADALDAIHSIFMERLDAEAVAQGAVAA